MNAVVVESQENKIDIDYTLTKTVTHFVGITIGIHAFVTQLTGNDIVFDTVTNVPKLSVLATKTEMLVATLVTKFSRSWLYVLTDSMYCAIQTGLQSRSIAANNEG